MIVRVRRSLECPIDDLFEALHQLVRRDGRSGGYLCLLYRIPRLLGSYLGPRIVRQHIGGAYDMQVVAEDVFFLTEHLAKTLELEFTRGTPQWGYTDQNERHATDHAEKTYCRFRDERAEAAKAIEDFSRSVTGPSVSMSQ